MPGGAKLDGAHESVTKGHGFQSRSQGKEAGTQVNTPAPMRDPGRAHVVLAMAGGGSASLEFAATALEATIQCAKGTGRKRASPRTHLDEETGAETEGGSATR